VSTQHAIDCDMGDDCRCSARPMTIGYADPPYIGQSHRLYGDHRDYAGEVNHHELVDRLAGYDAWILHASAARIQDLYMLLPGPAIDTKKNKGRALDGTGTRMLVWIKETSAWRPVRVQYGWEPIFVYGGRRTKDTRPVLNDWLRAPASDRNGFTGSKPYEVVRYALDAIGAGPDDELDDLYPGSGAVGRHWERYCAQGVLA
jgi:hypothetical protein